MTYRPRIPDEARRGRSCCSWLDFREGFEEAYQKWFDAPPTKHRWRWAILDWHAGNTGWEAAHNAKRRARANVRKRTC